MEALLYNREQEALFRAAMPNQRDGIGSSMYPASLVLFTSFVGACIASWYDGHVRWCSCLALVSRACLLAGPTTSAMCHALWPS